MLGLFSGIKQEEDPYVPDMGGKDKPDKGNIADITKPDNRPIVKPKRRPRPRPTNDPQKDFYKSMQGCGGWCMFMFYF